MVNEIISAAALIAVAVIEAISVRERRRSKWAREREERHAAVRATESRLAMQMMDAALELGLATALAVEEKKLNGEMKRARIKAQGAQREYEEFVHGLAARQVAKI